MSKFFKNLYKLLSIKTPFFIIINFISNFWPNYKTKNKCKKLESFFYKNFKSYNIKEKWFCNNLYFLKKNLEKLPNIKNILEIGSYEGRSAIFFLNLFNESIATCVDTWTGSDEHHFYNFRMIENNFDFNTKTFLLNNRIKKFKTTSNDFFASNNNKFDLIYVDGDHSSKQVKVDIEESWKILNNKGFLVLDDYLWWYYNDLKNNPAHAINNFILNNKEFIVKLIVWKQVIIQKK